MAGLADMKFVPVEVPGAQANTDALAAYDAFIQSRTQAPEPPAKSIGLGDMIGSAARAVQNTARAVQDTARNVSDAAPNFQRGFMASEEPLLGAGRFRDGFTAIAKAQRDAKIKDSVLDKAPPVTEYDEATLNALSQLPRLQATQDAMIANARRPSMTPVSDETIILPTGGLGDALANVPGNTGRGLGSVALKALAIAPDVIPAIYPENTAARLRKEAQGLDRQVSVANLRINDDPLFRFGNGLDNLVPSARDISQYVPEGAKQLVETGLLGPGAIIADAGVQGFDSARTDGLSVGMSTLKGAANALTEGVPEAMAAKFAVHALDKIPMRTLLSGDAKVLTQAMQQSAKAMGVELGSEQFSAVSGWYADKMFADPTATPDRLKKDLADAFKATLIQGPTMIAGGKAMQSAFNGMAAAAGLSEKAAASARLKIATMSPDAVPGFLSKFMDGMARRGAATPVPQAEQILTAARDAAIAKATQPAIDPALQQAGGQSALQPLLYAGGAAHDVPVAPPQDAPVNAEELLGAVEPEPLNQRLEQAAHEAATSPLNDRAEPTDAQKKAGTYKMGHHRIAGMDVTIENPAGSTRRGTDPDGTPWETPMNHHYGYFKGTTANDGDKLDVFIKPGTPDDFKGAVFVVDQIDPKTGKLDEHKVILGAKDQAEAESIYRSNYDANWAGFGAITQLPMPAFKAWAKSGAKNEPLGEIHVSNPGDVRGRTAGAAGGGRVDAGAGVDAGVGDVGAAGPAMDAGRAGVVPAGSAVSLPNGRPADAVTTASNAPIQAPQSNGLKPINAANPVVGRPGESNPTIVDAQGNEYRVHSQRNNLVIAHPIVDGKAQVNRDSAVRFWTNPELTPSGENDRVDPIFQKQGSADAPTPATLGPQSSPAPGAQAAPQAGTDVANGIAPQTIQAAPAQAPAPAGINPPAAATNSAEPAGQPGAGARSGAVEATGLTHTLRSDGTLSVQGDYAAILQQLKDGGIPARSTQKSANGLVVGRTQAGKAQQILSAPAQPAIQPTAPQPAAAAPAPIRIGRNGVDLEEGGKPFKTKAEATKAKALHQGMRVVRSPDKAGFVLVEQTAAQRAAAEQAAKRLRNPNTSVRGAPIPAHSFIAADGGLHKSVMADAGFDRNQRVGNRWMFSDQGMSIEQATSRLVQDGYLKEGASHSDALNLIRKSFSTPQYNAEGWQRMAEAEMATRFDDHLAAQQEASSDPFSELDNLDFTPDDADVSGYDASTDPIKLEVNALLAQAEALGIDTDAIKEEAYEATRNGSEQDYYEAQRDQLKAAIQESLGGRGHQADSREGVEPRGQDAIGEGGVDRRTNAGQQGDAGILTAPTRDEVVAQQDRSGNAAALDERQQIDREASAQTLTAQTAPDQRKDTTTDIFGGPSVEDARKAKEAEDAKKAKTPEGPSLFDAPQEANPTAPAQEAPAIPGDIASIFTGLNGRGMKKTRAQEAAEAHAQAEQIAYVQENFHDILIRLMDAGRLSVNGHRSITEENKSCL